MQYRTLGSTDLKVSALMLGTMTFGEQNSVGDAHSQLDYAVARGINFLDTSEHYPVPPRRETQGRTEAFIGEWLKKAGNRQKVLVATKAVGPNHAGRISSSHIREGNNHYTRANLEAALNASLKRLQIDVIDLYQLHWPDRSANFFGRLGYEHDDSDQAVPIEDTLAVLADFIKAGKVRHIGVSNETPWGLSRYVHLAELRGLPRIASVQNPYSLLNRTFDIGCAEVALREHVSLLGYSPLAFGRLTGKYERGAKPPTARLTLWDRFMRYNSPPALAAADEYVDLARHHGLDPGHMAIAWALSRRVVTCPIIGATSLEQLQHDIDAAEVVLSPEVLAAIDAIHARIPNPAP